jgi:hypothetical protein
MKINWHDLADRTLWTLAEAGAGVLATEAASIPVWWAVPISTVLAAVKTYAMQHVTKGQ